MCRGESVLENRAGGKETRCLLSAVQEVRAPVVRPRKGQSGPVNTRAGGGMGAAEQRERGKSTKGEMKGHGDGIRPGPGLCRQAVTPGFGSRCCHSPRKGMQE